MKSIAAWGALLAAIAAAQVVLVPGIEIYHVRPDLFLVSVVIVGMRMGSGSGMIWGGCAGLVQDALSGGIIGFNFLSKPVTGFFVGLLRNKLDFDNPNTQSLVTLSATLGEGAVLSVLVSAYHPDKDVLWSLAHVVLPLGVYNAVVMPLVIVTARVGAAVKQELRRRESRLAE